MILPVDISHVSPLAFTERTAGCACRSAATTDFRHTFRDQSCIGLTTGSQPEWHLTDANWTRSACSGLRRSRGQLRQLDGR